MDTWVYIGIGLIGWQFFVTIYLIKQWWKENTISKNQYERVPDHLNEINQQLFVSNQEKDQVNLEIQNNIQSNTKINNHDQEKSDTKINNLEERISILELNFNQKNQQINLQYEKLNAQEKQINLQQEKLNAQEKQINLIQEQQNAQEKQINLIQEQMNAQKKQINLIQEQLNAQEKQINLQQKQLNAQEKQINLIQEENNQGKVQIKKVNENKIDVVQNEQQKQEKQLSTETIINNLKQASSQSRQIEQQFRPYVRDLLEKQDFRKHYSLNLQTSNKLFNYCNQLRLVRGDGNCFYTAFGYQFLSILLNDYSADQFKQFIEKIKSIKLPMKIYLQGNDFKIDDKELEEELLQNFLDRLIKLKNIQDENQRQAEFHVQFAAYEKQSETIDSCFYELSTLFFRNFSNYILDFSETKGAVADRENLLLWEQECNSNEVIIAELAKSLNIFILLIFIVNGSNFTINQYGNEQNNKIILVMKPGHYNIGYFQQQIQQSQNILENKDPEISYTNINQRQVLD